VLSNQSRPAVTDQTKALAEIWKENTQKTAFASCKRNRQRGSVRAPLQKAPATCQLGTEQSGAAADPASVTFQGIRSPGCPPPKRNTGEHGWLEHFGG